MQGRKWILGISKRNVLLMTCLIGLVFTLGAGCHREREKSFDVRQVALSEEEEKMAGMLSDVFGRFELKVGKSYNVRVYSYSNGEVRTVGAIDNVTPLEGNNAFNVVGTDQQGGTTRWAIYMDSEQLDITVDNQKALGDGGYSYKSKILLEPGGVILAPDEERALLVMIYKKMIRDTAQALTPLVGEGIRPEMVGQMQTLSEENDLVYMVTVSLAKNTSPPKTAE